MKRWIWIVMLALAACSSQQAEPTLEVYENEVGSFIVNVSGDHQRDFNGAGVYADLGDEGIILTLSDENAAMTAVLIALPAGIEAGTYDLISYTGVFEESGGVSAAGASYTEGGTIYGSVTAGSITLQTLNPLTGNFTFSATNEGKTVTVNGIMNQIPAMEQG
jgi:hypothetical protein